MRFLSPLRYPGGKAALAPFFGAVLENLPQRVRTYVEPFAGGAGSALRLMVDEYVDRIVINDVNPGVAEMWQSVFHRTSEFLALLRSTPVTVDEWHNQRAVYEDRSAPGLARGFATFFLNRTNRSGILGARPIGGLRQTGKWAIDARFNVDELSDRITFVAQYRNRVEVWGLDALDLLNAYTEDAQQVVIYADPPYLLKSLKLYTDSCSWNTHREVASTLSARFPYWLATYDEDKRVRSELYPSHKSARFSLSHTAGTQRVGTEVAVFSDYVAQLVEVESLGPHGGVWLN